jgi:adenylate cyclase
MIGDAAMIVAPDPEALLGSALELVAQADEIEAFPRLRAGAAYGPALGRSGDWYGRPINVASRVTDIAEPGTVVGTQELCEAAGESCPWTSVGRHTLKGIEGDVELFRAERNAAGKPPS